MPCHSYLLLAADKLVPQAGALVADSFSLEGQYQRTHDKVGRSGAANSSREQRRGRGVGASCSHPSQALLRLQTRRVGLKSLFQSSAHHEGYPPSRPTDEDKGRGLRISRDKYSHRCYGTTGVSMGNEALPLLRRPVCSLSLAATTP